MFLVECKDGLDKHNTALLKKHCEVDSDRGSSPELIVHSTMTQSMHALKIDASRFIDTIIYAYFVSQLFGVSGSPTQSYFLKFFSFHLL